MPGDATPRQISLPRKIVFSAFVAAAILGLVYWFLWEFVLEEYKENQAAHARSARYKVEGTVRMLFVGDSYTEGGLSESGSGYWAYVPQAMADAGFRRPVEVVSVAIPGSDTWFHMRQFRAFLDESGQVPDYVVLRTGANNRQAYDFQSRFCRTPEGERSVPGWLRVLHAGPQSLRFAFNQLGRLVDADGYHGEHRTAFGFVQRTWEQNRSYGEWLHPATALAFGAFVAEARRRGIAPIAGSYHHDALDDAVRSAALELGVPFHDIDSDEVRARFHEDGLLTEDGWHPNDRGHRFLARLFAEWFVATVGQGEPRRPLP